MASGARGTQTVQVDFRLSFNFGGLGLRLVLGLAWC